MRAPVREVAYRGGALVDGAERSGKELPICIDAARFSAKPDGAQTAQISKRIASCGFIATAWEIALSVSEGATILPGMFDGNRDIEHWTGQRVFLVDVDNDKEQARRGYKPLGEWEAVYRAYAYGLPIVMSYQTFSGSAMDADPVAQRFRLAFVAPSVFESKERAEAFAAGVLAAYPEADQSSGELARMFYGTDKEVSVWA